MYNKILDSIKGEILIIDRTINILKTKSTDYEGILRRLEEKNGVSGIYFYFIFRIWGGKKNIGSPF